MIGYKFFTIIITVLLIWLIYVTVIFRRDPALCKSEPIVIDESKNDVESVSINNELKNFSVVIEEFKNCMRSAAKIYLNDRKIFFQEFNTCIKTHISIDESEMDNFENTLNEEKKMFIPLKNKKAECKWVTIGVGNVDAAERKFKEQYSHCSVYGFEPDITRQGNFHQVGTIKSYGVGM
uniref:Uncharacterized protein n=1 Tax=Panagrolaimus sp. ES5 TaxID=591445 RepID=A0AC34G0M2_9BILA